MRGEGRIVLFVWAGTAEEALNTCESPVKAKQPSFSLLSKNEQGISQGCNSDRAKFSPSRKSSPNTSSAYSLPVVVAVPANDPRRADKAEQKAHRRGVNLLAKS